MIVLDKLLGFARFTGKCTQGIVGRCVLNGTPIVWKISKRASFVCESEYETGKVIMDSPLHILPHFVKVIDCTDVYLSSKDRVPRTCLMMEEIRGGRLLDVILNCGECRDVLNLTKQILLAIEAAQQIVQFTHYDLHIENVLVRETDDDKYVYIFPDGSMHLVETNGLCAVIIDYGYAYTSKAKTILPSLYHNDAGFQSFQFSPLSDVMTLLCSTVYEFRHSESHFVQQVSNMFRDMPSTFNRECGWIEGYTNLPKAMARILKPPISDVRSDSIFRDVPVVVDLIQALVEIPLDSRADTYPNVSYTKTFAALYYQWFLVEEELANPELEALFLKTVIRSVRESRPPADLIKSVFGREFEVDYDVIVNCIQHIATIIRHGIRQIEKRDRERRDRYYSKLKISSPMDVYKRIDKTPVTFMKEDRVKFFDLRNGTTSTVEITKVQAKRLNNGTLSLKDLYRESSV